MQRNIASMFLIIICLYSNQVNSQIISFSPGSEFNIVAGTTLSFSGLTITPSANFSLNTNLDLTNSIANTSTFPYVPRVYQFDHPTNPFSGTLEINYLDNELTGLGFTETAIKILYHDGAWAIDNASVTNDILNITTSSSVVNKSLNEIIAGICLPSTSSQAIKLANQSTLAKLLIPALHTWSILPGGDASDFTIDSNNPQQLQFNPFADYANPNDSDQNNTYLVDVSDGCDTKSLIISISPFCGDWSYNVSP